MSSYSSPLPPYVTPGWNDPPANISSERKNSTLITHRHRRPVDPSIQGSVFKAVQPPLQHMNSQVCYPLEIKQNVCLRYFSSVVLRNFFMQILLSIFCLFYAEVIPCCVCVCSMMELIIASF
uniref:Uncharacterized protein n=1 Tax=Parascaris equorum TaxID=6256 RepID=A0A914REZ8_PAREQ